MTLKAQLVRIDRLAIALKTCGSHADPIRAACTARFSSIDFVALADHCAAQIALTVAATGGGKNIPARDVVTTSDAISSDAGGTGREGVVRSRFDSCEVGNWKAAGEDEPMCRDMFTLRRLLRATRSRGCILSGSIESRIWGFRTQFGSEEAIWSGGKRDYPKAWYSSSR